MNEASIERHTFSFSWISWKMFFRISSTIHVLGLKSKLVKVLVHLLKVGVNWALMLSLSPSIHAGYWHKQQVHNLSGHGKGHLCVPHLHVTPSCILGVLDSYPKSKKDKCKGPRSIINESQSNCSNHLWRRFKTFSSRLLKSVNASVSSSCIHNLYSSWASVRLH